MGKLRGLLIIVVIGCVIYFAYDTYTKKNANSYDIDLRTYTLEMETTPGRIINVIADGSNYKYMVAFNGPTQKNITFETQPIAVQMQIQDTLDMYIKSDTDYICVYDDQIIYASEEAIKAHKKGLLS